MGEASIRTVEEHPLGMTWVMDEPMGRASHALVAGGRVWLVDPIESGDVVERAAALGEPAGVLRLLDRHNRDCEEVARKLGVACLKEPAGIPDCPFEPVPVVSNRAWREVALWWPERKALVVPEAIGTNRMAHPGPAGAGVHIALRLKPPRAALGRFEPEHLLVGHGEPIHGPRAAEALHEALDRARKDMLGAIVGMPRAMRS